MKEIKECKIVSDLFPSYIDRLINDETNQYIEEHLNECNACKDILENMKKDLKLDENQKKNTEVKYIKKFSNRMKLLRTILLVILLTFLLMTSRNAFIILTLNNKISKYSGETNYYIKSFNYSGDSMVIIENYKKDEKYVNKVQFLSEGYNRAIYTEYYNGKTINSYNEIEDKRIAILNKNENINLQDIPNTIKIDNLIQFIAMSIFSSITSVECNGKQCYQIVEPWFNSKSETIYYIEKESGLTVRVIGAGKEKNDNSNKYDIVTDYQYKFNVVTDENFIEPNISEYEIQN